MEYKTIKAISTIKKALNAIQKDYRENPLYFINERSVQARIYAELFKYFYKPREVQVNEFRNKSWNEIQIKHKTIPLFICFSSSIILIKFCM